MTKCPDCGGFETDNSPDGIHCRNCGLVLDDTPIENNPFVSEATKSNSSLPGLGVGGTKPVNGKYVMHHWLISTREKNLYKAKKKLGFIASKLKLPKYVEKEAYLIFKNAVDRNLNVGRDNITMLYGSVYASCIMHNIPKTPLEITAFTSVNKNRMLNAYKVLKSSLKLRIEQIDPVDFVHRFGSRLELKQTTITLAADIITKLKKCPIIIGKHPKTIVASALYIASKMNDDYRTQREIANATGIIEVTLRKRSREINEELKECSKYK